MKSIKYILLLCSIPFFAQAQNGDNIGIGLGLVHLQVNASKRIISNTNLTARVYTNTAAAHGVGSGLNYILFDRSKFTFSAGLEYHYTWDEGDRFGEQFLDTHTIEIPIVLEYDLSSRFSLSLSTSIQAYKFDQEPGDAFEYTIPAYIGVQYRWGRY